MTFSAPENPYESPRSEITQVRRSIRVPTGVSGKLVRGLQLFCTNLPLISTLVLIIWLPAHIVIDTLVARSAEPDNPFAAMPLNFVVDAFFSPIMSGALIWQLSEKMEGRKGRFFAALRVGLWNYPRLFASRLVASFLIVIGLIALIVPGIMFGVRFALIDEAVVLEGAGIARSRARSEELVTGNGWEILLTGLVNVGVMILVAVSLGIMEVEFPQFDTFWGNVGSTCVLDILSMYIACVLFLFYCEGRDRRRKSSSMSHSQLIDLKRTSG